MRRMLAVSIPLLGALCSCGNAPEKPRGEFHDHAGLPATAGPDEAQGLAVANSQFAFELYRVLPTSGNLIYSPHSIASGLAMLYAGARGSTAQQLANSVHFNLKGEPLLAAFATLNHNVLAIGGDDAVQLRQANAIWTQSGLNLQAGFVDMLMRHYRVAPMTADFASQPEPVRREINAWVENHTAGYVKALLPAGSVDSMTRLVIANALHLKGAWQCPFKTTSTREGDFELANGAHQRMPMMVQTDSYRYAENADLQAVAVTLQGAEMSLLLLLPRAGKFARVEASLDAAFFYRLIGDLQLYGVRLRMPRFAVTTHTDMVPALQSLGITQAFGDGEADFSGITDTGHLHADHVMHTAVITADESGVEAAAATGGTVSCTSLPLVDATVDVNRPFLFAVWHHATKAVLFIGRVANPSGS